MMVYRPTRIREPQVRIDELIDELCEAIGTSRVVVLTVEQTTRFAWYVTVTRWEWMEA